MDDEGNHKKCLYGKAYAWASWEANHSFLAEIVEMKGFCNLVYSVSEEGFLTRAVSVSSSIGWIYCLLVLFFCRILPCVLGGWVEQPHDSLACHFTTAYLAALLV